MQIVEQLQARITTVRETLEKFYASSANESDEQIESMYSNVAMKFMLTTLGGNTGPESEQLMCMIIALGELHIRRMQAQVDAQLKAQGVTTHAE